MASFIFNSPVISIRKCCKTFLRVQAQISDSLVLMLKLCDIWVNALRQKKCIILGNAFSLKTVEKRHKKTSKYINWWKVNFTRRNKNTETISLIWSNFMEHSKGTLKATYKDAQWTKQIDINSGVLNKIFLDNF